MQEQNQKPLLTKEEIKQIFTLALRRRESEGRLLDKDDIALYEANKGALKIKGLSDLYTASKQKRQEEVRKRRQSIVEMKKNQDEAIKAKDELEAQKKIVDEALQSTQQELLAEREFNLKSDQWRGQIRLGVIFLFCVVGLAALPLLVDLFADVSDKMLDTYENMLFLIIGAFTTAIGFLFGGRSGKVRMAKSGMENEIN